MKFEAVFVIGEVETVPNPAIPYDEYPQRLERLRAGMREKDLAAVLVGTGPNLTYFSGYPSPSRSGSRPFFLLLPREGEPVLIVHSGRKAEALRLAHVRDVRDYAELSRIPVELVVGALREYGALGQSVGMELGHEQFFDVPYEEMCRLREALSGTQIVDAGDLLWRIRMIKSASEIACLRAACQILSAAYEATLGGARAGQTELRIAQRMNAHFDQAGAGDRFIVITSGPANYDLPSKPPEARALQETDMVWIDAGCTVAGYWSDFSRAGVVGGPTAEQAAAQEAIHRITWEAVLQVRPGVKVAELARFCNDQVARLPFPITSDISGLASRCGHGVGLNLTEPPHIAETEPTVLEPGMVITIEPAVATEYGTFHVEELVLVTADGAEVLSQAPRDLWHLPPDGESN